MTSPKGHCLWGVVPFAPKRPFEVYVEDGKNEKGNVGQFVTAASSGEPEFRVVSTVKTRPVIVVTDIYEPWGEVLVLRLKKLSKIRDKDEQQRVRSHEDPYLFHLTPDRFKGLPEENAAMIATLTRVPIESLDRSRSLGKAG